MENKQKTKYLKEIENLTNKHAKLLTHHTQSVLKQNKKSIKKIEK